jgi:uncharacterized protein YcgI (DUF1989 family)
MIIELLEGPQVVHVFFFNRSDPDERYWAHETCLIEGLFLSRYSRLWGTMARFRPLLAILEDSVAHVPEGSSVNGKHHPAYGGAGTPAAWRRSGGSASVPSVWEQFARLLRDRGLSPSLIKDEVCLFQKTRINPYAKKMEPVRPDCLAGDHVALYAECELVVFLALSPYIDGVTQPADELPSVRPVGITTTDRIAKPLGWPYPDVLYPDLSLYLDETGVRSSRPEATPPRTRTP